MKVLIVDDDAGLRKSVSLILSDAGYDVLTACDGEEGPGHCADRATRPDPM